MAEKKQQIENQEKTKYGLKYHTDDSKSSRIERTVNNKFLSDVTFVVGPEKQRIYAHKLPLVTASEYFYTLFYGNFAEAQLDEIELKDADPEIFLTILRIIYGANVEISDDNIRDINNHMRMYLLPMEHYKPLVKFLKDQVVDKDTAMKIFRENHHYKFQLVDDVCLSIIRNDPLYYFGQDEFCKIEEERMLKIVDSQQINCTDEQLLRALETCEFTNGKYDTKKMNRLVGRTTRKYLSHKLPVLCAIEHSSAIYYENITLQLTSPESVALHGMGIYIVPTKGAVSVKLDILSRNNSYTQIGSLNYVERSNPCLEIVDLMFAEIVLEQDNYSCFRIRFENKNGMLQWKDSVSPVLVHDNIQIKFIGTKQTSAIAHLWVKRPECGVGANQAPQSCCQLKK